MEVHHYLEAIVGLIYWQEWKSTHDAGSWRKNSKFFLLWQNFPQVVNFIPEVNFLVENFARQLFRMYKKSNRSLPESEVGPRKLIFIDQIRRLRDDKVNLKNWMNIQTWNARDTKKQQITYFFPNNFSPILDFRGPFPPNTPILSLWV